MLSNPVRLVSLVGPPVLPLHRRLDKNARFVLLHVCWMLLTSRVLTALSFARPGPGRTWKFEPLPPVTSILMPAESGRPVHPTAAGSRADVYFQNPTIQYHEYNCREAFTGGFHSECKCLAVHVCNCHPHHNGASTKSSCTIDLPCP
jgi:hypothetical protein